ncbi:hypothetical protein ABT213_20465 [Streptomyces sp. NPDC001674]|uniref:hypothetical protein n=1 Tax=Streptomyces sp. NPDC001674 TaxID=3154394 RepID=UPI00332EC48D
MSASQNSLGRKIREWVDPFALEVHRSIDSGLGESDVSILPRYIRRRHDSQLDDMVSRAIDGKNVVAVLVGESATGKTRACWEAVQKLPDSWSLWHPIYPGHSEALLDGLRTGVPPRTVLWLNETQLYLNTAAGGAGELAAAGLRELLRDPQRGPYLILGTMWPEYWGQLTRHPEAQFEDGHPQARMLLAHSDISVPDSFFGESLNDLKNAVGTDPRLAESYKNVNGSRARITQFLAGAPVQMERYRNAPGAAKAILDAAIDLRRFGHGPVIPGGLLAELASVAMDADLFNSIDDSWFEFSLEYLLSPCRGASGPLVRVRRFPGSPVRGEESFQVADYLEQVGRLARSAHFPPPAMVDVALRGITETEGLKSLGAFLVDTGRVFHAAQFYLQALDLGDCEAAGKLADLLEYAEDRKGAVEVARARHRGGDPAGSGDLAYYLHRNGQRQEAEELCIKEFDLGNFGPLFRVRESCRIDEDDAGYEALEDRILSRRYPGLYSEIFRTGDASGGARRVAEGLGERLGISTDEAMKLVDEELELIGPRLDLITQGLGVQIGAIKESHDRLTKYVEKVKSGEGVHGETRVLRARIEAFQEAGDPESARSLIAEGLNRGIIGLEILGDHLERFSQLTTAESVDRLGVDWDGNPCALWNLADVRRANRAILGNPLP